jgi:excisionase family DNA binding protein
MLNPSGREPLAVGVRDAAQLLSVSERHVWHLIESGVLPAIRLGGRVLIRVAAIEAALAQRESARSNDAETKGNGNP